jgi:DNA-binding SARP family transcriptional activator
VPVIEVRVLGPLEAMVGGVRADLGGPRRRCVLARLAAEQGRVVSADRLIEDLYADEAPPRALAALQAHISHLRRALEPGRDAGTPSRVLATAPPGYALRLERESVDAWRFEDQVHDAAALDDPAVTYARLSAALESWRGGAFAEFAGMAWVDLEGARLEELRLTAVERLAAAALELGRAAEAVADLGRLVTEHPLREEAWRLLALALYQSGRQGDALAALRRARARLAEDLGVDPGPALRTLEDDILAQAPHLSPAPPVGGLLAPPATSRASAAQAGSVQAGSALSSVGQAVMTEARLVRPPGEPYVGRDLELTQIMNAAVQAAAGRIRIVLVTGEAGAGKTALVGQASQRLGAQGWMVAAGRCPEDEGAPPGWPWAEALRELTAAATPADPELLAPLLADRPPVGGDASAARFRLHRAVAAYLRAASHAAPLLVVLDDLHRADRETLAILTNSAAGLANSRVLVLATYRPAEVGEALSECLAALAGREPTRIPLRGLDTPAAAELIRAASTRAVDDATVRVIAERTGGNPFFLKETSRLLDSEGALAAISEVPAGVADVLARRIARLPATAQTILRQAAVIGIETNIDVLADVSGAAEDVVLDAVEAGLLTGLVTEPAAGRIKFAHALVRDALYQGLSRLRRSRLHARAAQAIESHSPGEVAALAYHFAEAGTEPAAAARYARLAAEQAEQRFAYHEAVRLWEQAITGLDRVDGADARDRLELVLGLVRALAQTGELTRARSWRQGAIRAALPLGDPALLAEVITAFDVPTLWTGKEYGAIDHELVDTVEQALSRLPPGDGSLHCRLLATLAFELDGGESERGYEASVEAMAMARRLGDPFALTMALNSRYMLSFRHDGPDERLRLGAELLALPSKPVTVEALAHLMLMQANSGNARFDEADLHADEAERIAERYNLPLTATRTGFYRALRAALAGDPSAAECYQQAAGQLGRLGMWQHGAALSLLGRCCILIMQDRAAEAIGEIEPFYHYPPWSAIVAELYALTIASSGRMDEARSVAGQPGPIRLDRHWLLMTSIRGLLGMAIDDRERAESAYQALLPFASRPAGSDSGMMTLWPAALILGDLARYLGRPDAQAHYQHALAIADQAQVRTWAESARNRLAALQGRAEINPSPSCGPA